MGKRLDARIRDAPNAPSPLRQRPPRKPLDAVGELAEWWIASMVLLICGSVLILVNVTAALVAIAAGTLAFAMFLVLPGDERSNTPGDSESR